ncbi:hypothetical protein DTO169E5_2220 [Paecilomyces variotii]|nr:hypothetical protein DTO169E5_2220 [Paecilomyces variotii]
MAPAVPIARDIIGIANNTHPQWWRDPGLRRLNILLGGVMLGSVAFGFDQALIGGLEADPRWFSDLELTSTSKQGVVIAGVSFGLLIALLPAAHLVDTIGRRWSIILSNIVLIGAVVGQAFTSTASQFLGTRIVLGVVSSILSTASPSLLAELAHPRQRAQITAMYMTFFYVGSTTAAWSCYGSLHVTSSWSWRLPVMLQIPWAILQLSIVFFCPDSPRWLVAKGRENEARQVLVKYHANNAQDDELVEKEFQEIIIDLRAEKEEGTSGSRGWILMFSSLTNAKRTFMVIFLALSVQWVGNGIISYYLPAVLETVGIRNSSQQQGVNGGLQIWNLVMAVVGALLAERVGRKKLLLISAYGMLISMILLIVCSAVYDDNPQSSNGAGKAVIVFIFTFFGCYDIGFTPIPPLYVSELSPTNLRAKYLALYWFATGCALCFNQYVNPTAFSSIHWKYYLVYVGVLVVVILVVTVFAPETKGLTLEEVASIFDKNIARKLAERYTEEDIGEKNLEIGGTVELKENV